MLVAKKVSGLRPKYINSLRQYLTQFGKGREQTPIHEIGAVEIERWFSERSEALSTRASNIGRLSALFSYHVRKGVLKENPVKRLERIRVDRRAPFVLTPHQAKQLLATCPETCKPYLILGLFAGVRPDEILKLKWDDICFDTQTVAINDAKTRRRRIVPLEPKAATLLSQCRLKRGPVAPSNSTVRRWKRRARIALGLRSWPQDLLRHSFGSYALALHQDAGKVSTAMGNSSAILLTHYHEPIKQADCKEFWNI